MVRKNLITVEEFKEYLGIAATATNKDSRFLAIIGGVSQYVENYTGRYFTQTTITGELVQVDVETNKLFPRFTPIISVTSLKENNQILTLDTDYRVDPDGTYIEKLGYATSGSELKSTWVRTDGLATIYWPTVTYVSGYAVTPEDIKLATKEIAGIWAGEKMNTYESLGVVNSLTITELPNWVQGILDSYRIRRF